MGIYSMTHTVRAVSVDSLSYILPHVLPYLMKALSKAPEYSIDDILEDVVQEQATMFTIDDGEEMVGVAITRVEKHPQKTYLQIHLLGGTRLVKWADTLRKSMKEYATALGYDGVILYGRPGWKKIFPEAKVERIVLIDEIGV